MGLLLSVLITCVGVLEVIACYTHFRIGTAYNECKSNLRDVAKYYAVELRKHELHFEPGPDDTGPSTSQETLSELMRKRTVRTQEKSQSYSNGHVGNTTDITELKSNGHILTSCTQTPDQGTPNLAAKLKVPRNSVSGLDSPTVQHLISPELDITEAVEKIQNLESNEWIRKSPSPYPDKSGLEVVDKDFWKSRSPSPFPESKDSDSGVELIYTPGIKKTLEDVPPLLETPDIPDVVNEDFWNKPPIFTQSSVDSTYSRTDLEVQDITGNMQYNEALFGITADTAENEDTKFDEAFLRSLDGMSKSSKCDDRRRSFRKKRNSSSTSSRASRDDISRSMTSLDDIESIEKSENKKISPLTEEDISTSEDVNGHQIRTEVVTPEKCESIASPTPKDKDEANVTKHEQTLFEAKVSPNVSQQDSSNPDKGKANLNFTEKVKDLEISVQLLVTVKGTSQGDKMEYTTTVSQDDQKPKSQKALDVTDGVKEESITKTTEDKSEFGNVKTSITYGSSVQQDATKVEPNLKDLQISSQSLIHAERTVQDDVTSSEAEFLKLYESFTELPDRQKDQFLKIIGKSTKSTDDIENVENISQKQISEILSDEGNEENPPEEIIKKSEIAKAPKEKIEITEITEITESTESVITVPPEKSVIVETPDANISQISTSDNKSDNVVITSTKKCDQGGIVKQTNQIEVIEGQITQNKEMTNVEKQNEIVNNETEINSQQIRNKQNIATEPNKLVKNEPKIINTSTTVTTEEPKIIQQTTNITESIEQPKIEQNLSHNTTLIQSEFVNTEAKIPEETLTTQEKQIETTKSVEITTTNVNEYIEQPRIEQNLSQNTTLIQSEIVNTETKIPEETLTTKEKIVEETVQIQVKKPVLTEQQITIQKQEVQPTITEQTIEETKKSSDTSELQTQIQTSKTSTEQQITIQSQEVQPTITEQTIEEPKKSSETSSDPKNESSSDSSSTPSTVIETQMRRASTTVFEDASPVQNQEMLKRRVSNSEISPKQASQAFWLIFSAEYTNAMEKDWHGQHFSCWQCDESLTGQRYVLRDDHPYCVKCYEQVFANPCEKCNRIIGIDSKDLSYKDKHWHEACFQCTTCSESLVDKQFGAKGEKIYCGNCYDKQFASRCDGCGKIFHAGTKKMEYKNRQWHEQCFKCCKCETPIGTKSFIPREKDIYCAGCYEEKFATRCVKCDKAIQSGGVTYKNEPWHRECFTCTHCNKNLAGQRFTSRDDKPCCAECFGRLFAKRCTSCSEPITGIGGTRFISFEDRHWHNDCFICASCSTSLVGRGFITDEDKIICPECAKERFM